jgi:hypothetical protein
MRGFMQRDRDDHGNRINRYSCYLIHALHFFAPTKFMCQPGGQRKFTTTIKRLFVR